MAEEHVDGTRLLRTFAFLLFLVVLLRHAWVCDDAYITVRTIDNFVHGRGLVWNVGERVQSYTHPLWMLLVSVLYFVTREAFFTIIALSVAITMAAVWLVGWRHARSPAAGVLAITALAVSQSFVDYSTSGLENPLTHLLVALFLLVYLGDDEVDRRKILRLSLIASLATLNRQDTVLFFLPPLAQAVWATRRPRLLLTVLKGMTPLIAWELFSLLYYGVPLPNTAYAKLGSGIAAGELAAQGLLYYVSTLHFDPVTLWLLAAGLVLGAGRRGRELVVAAGALLYLLYIVKIGGDFMLGRFLSAPFLVAVVLVVRHPWLPAGAAGLVPSGLVLAVAALASFPTLRADGDYKKQRVTGDTKDSRGVGDERAFYQDTNGLLSARRGLRMPADNPMAKDGMRARREPGRVAIFWATGMAGTFAGPEKHVIDHYALTDPLLARLPAQRTFDWRIGHFARYIPDGYLETLDTGENHITDPGLHRLWDDLRLVTRGPIFSGARLAAIWRLNTGQDDHLIDVQAFARPNWRLVQAPKLLLDGQPAPETAGPSPQSLLVRFDGKRNVARLVLRVDGERAYRVAFLSAVEASSIEYGAVTLPAGAPGMRDALIDVPARAVKLGYDTLKIVTVDGRGPAPVAGWRDAP